MMDAERFLLKWNNHQSNLITVFDQLYEQEAFTDVTLACDGRSFAAHKVILSACSPYFQQLFINNPCQHPIIFMRDVRASDLDALLAFMYRGEINVHQQDLASFLKTAESLQIKGLSDSSDKPRDTSKILEAMEKKFSASAASNVSPSNTTSNSAFAGAVALMGSALSRTPMNFNNVASPISSSPNMSAFGRSLFPQLNNKISRDNVLVGPPEKKFKPSPEELTKILPQIKNLVSSQPIMTPMPGLITPITLAANVMKNAAHQIPVPIPYLSSREIPLENNNTSPKPTELISASKEKRMEGFISGDAPHPIYLVSSVGGLGTSASGNSTPSQDIKIEDEDPLDESNFSDDPNVGSNENMDDNGVVYNDDISNSERLTYPCRYCGKRFTQTGTCRRHERLHTAPNSFKCPFCQKGFNRKYRLKEHIISAHPEQAENQDLTVLINNSDASLV